mmetsp:Transcript_41013/g.30163  ORF Transcript_41013/g.30163 Transcript_41013/m.30163 type:complete len:200 (-) Transcript_41013:83-682(-)
MSSLSQSQVTHLSSDILSQARNAEEGGIFSTAIHPVVCFFQIFFKGLGLFCYLFLNFMIGQEIFSFIVIISLAAFDFWTVKNVTGRLLVGLRWWSEIKEDGREEWVFESVDEAGQKQVGATDSFVFWTTLYLTPIVWLFFALMALLSLKLFWFNIALVCAVLSAINVVGYYKCQQDHKRKLQAYLQETAWGWFGGSIRE